MDTTRFLDYLNDHPATQALAGSLAELVSTRRASALRGAGVQPIPLRVDAQPRMRAAG